MASAGGGNSSTRTKIISLIDDIEILSKELFDILAVPKGQRSEDSSTSDLIQLLVEKDAEIQENLKIANEQASIQEKKECLKKEIEKRDQDIKQLQKNLKEAEAILATAIYQAKQKLSSIQLANQKAVQSEELIKYAHRISANNSVAAPPTWAPGDPRRPYPTDIEMRVGYLGRLNEIALQNPGSLQTQFSIPELSGARHHPHLDHMMSSGLATSASSSWTTHDLNSTMSASATASQQMTVTIDSKSTKENEDVEVMSTDSSSSSSSDE
ncbi:mediator of RNA polymerase II transcription subunit 4-like [Tubulanus polymorphus]|uniref:mediator of RNA polymerase II transcription subunit 4-like n=1 Tax=Tubulanus polymorphus TaxID=672921 RepID=UPI003DA444FB